MIKIKMLLNLIIKLFLLLNANNFISALSLDSSSCLDNLNINVNTDFDPNKLKLYFPEYQNKYTRINELNNSNFNFSNIENNGNIFFVPNSIIKHYDNLYQQKK